MQIESFDKIYINSGNEDVLQLVTRPSSRILDAGCGSGALAKLLTSMGHQVDGITISEKESHIAGEFLQAVYLYNLENGLPENLVTAQYDYVICSHVLEHIVYPEKLLKQIISVLKDDGELIIALPNIMHYKSRFQLMLGNFNYKDAGIWDNTHVKWYTFKTAQQLLVENGFCIQMAGVTGELPLNSIWSKILSAKQRKILFSLLCSISKGFFGYQLLLKASKQ